MLVALGLNIQKYTVAENSLAVPIFWLELISDVETKTKNLLNKSFRNKRIQKAPNRSG